MTNRARAALILSFIMLVCPVARAQKAASISQLREQIRKMLAVDASDATTPEVRSLNRELLRERRAQLRELLQQRLDALLKYRAELKDSMTPDLDRSLRNSIADVMAEMEEVSGARGTSAPARRSPRRARAAAVTAPGAADDSAEATLVDASASAADAAPSQQVEQEAPVIYAPREVADKTAQVTVSNRNPTLTTFELYKDGKRIEVKNNDIKMPNATTPKEVSFKVEIGEGAPTTLYVLGYPDDRSFLVKSSVYEIKYNAAQAGEVAGSGGGKAGSGGDTAKKEKGVIDIKEPKNNGIFYDASLLDLKFSVTNKDKANRVDEVFIAVLDNKGVPIRQEDHSVEVEYEDDDALAAEVDTRVRIGEGVNEVRLFSGYEKGEPVNLTKVQVECRGGRCGAPVADNFSNSTNMRAIVGFEQAGASSAEGKGSPFLDFFFFGPLRYGNTCKGERRARREQARDTKGRRLYRDERGDLLFEDEDDDDKLRYVKDSNRVLDRRTAAATPVEVTFDLPRDPNGCFPVWSSWGNVRFSSLPTQASALGTFASNFVNPLAEGELTELVQGFNFTFGLDRYLFGSDRDFTSPIPGFKHRTGVYLTAGFGASNQLSPGRQATEIFKIPEDVDPQRARFIAEFPETDVPGAKYVAFAEPDRDRFLRHYYAGFRFKTHFIDKDGFLINQFPAILDVTFGQDDAVTAGRLSRKVFRLEAFYPFPIRSANFLYFYGSAFMKIGGKKTIRTPFFLERPGDAEDVDVTDNNVIITQRLFDNDFYRIGIGVNLTELFNRGSSPPR